MSRYKRIYYEHAIYHVVFRGNNRQRILQQPSDKKALLERIERYRNRYGFIVYAWVLMDNHVHMILGTQGLHNISKVMQSILLSYSCWFRKTYDYVGHVWQGRFKSYCITGESYLVECMEYIHNNPVRAKMVDYSHDYQWSSCRQHTGKENDRVEGLLKVNHFGDTSAVSDCGVVRK